MRRTLLSIAALALVVLAAGAAPAQVRTVSLSAQAVEAMTGATASVDPNIPQDLLGQLKATFQFNQWKSLGTFNGSAAVGQMWSTPLGASGYTFEATPKSVDGGAITLDARLTRQGSEVVKSTLRLQPGARVIFSGKAGTGGIFVAVTGR